MASSFLGIEIGGTKLQIVAGDGDGPIAERKRYTVEKERGAAGIRFQIEAALPQLIAQFKPAALGVGFGGPVNTAAGRIARSHQIEGWSEFPIREGLEGLFHLPTWVENDANTAALGEACCGAGKGANPVFYITLGSGVGGGLVVNRDIYHGVPPGESEVGHLRLDKTGTLVEERCSGWAVDGRIRKLKIDGGAGALCDALPLALGGEARFLPAALKTDDPVAWKLLREVADELALALSHVVHLFHPEVIVVGGGLSLVGEPLRAEIERALPRFLMKVFHGSTHVRLAGLGEDAVPVGCLIGARALLNR